MTDWATRLQNNPQIRHHGGRNDGGAIAIHGNSRLAGNAWDRAGEDVLMHADHDTTTAVSTHNDRLNLPPASSGIRGIPRGMQHEPVIPASIAAPRTPEGGEPEAVVGGRSSSHGYRNPAIVSTNADQMAEAVDAAPLPAQMRPGSPIYADKVYYVNPFTQTIIDDNDHGARWPYANGDLGELAANAAVHKQTPIPVPVSASLSAVTATPIPGVDNSNDNSSQGQSSRDLWGWAAKFAIGSMGVAAVAAFVAAIALLAVRHRDKLESATTVYHKGARNPRSPPSPSAGGSSPSLHRREWRSLSSLNGREELAMAPPNRGAAATPVRPQSAQPSAAVSPTRCDRVCPHPQCPTRVGTTASSFRCPQCGGRRREVYRKLVSRSLASSSIDHSRPSHSGRHPRRGHHLPTQTSSADSSSTNAVIVDVHLDDGRVSVNHRRRQVWSSAGGS